VYKYADILAAKAEANELPPCGRLSVSGRRALPVGSEAGAAACRLRIMYRTVALRFVSVMLRYDDSTSANRSRLTLDVHAHDPAWTSVPAEAVGRAGPAEVLPDVTALGLPSLRVDVVETRGRLAEGEELACDDKAAESIPAVCLGATAFPSAVTAATPSPSTLD